MNRSVCGSLLICLILLTTHAPARQAQRTATFSLGKRCAPVSMDPYCGRLVPERKDPAAYLRVRLTVQPTFDRHGIELRGGQILNVQGNRIMISCRSDAIEAIAALPGVVRCTVSRLVEPQMDSARLQCRIDQVHGTLPVAGFTTAYTGRGVIAGIIDSEFDTRHPAFLDEDGMTRFLAIWDQNDSSGAARNPFGYGTIKNRGELSVDTQFALNSTSHGTHTSSTMAGSDLSSRYYGAAPGAMLVAVCYSGTEEIADGLKWISSFADSLGVPCVINMSLGIASGPHDGTSLVDRTIDSISREGLIVVGAIGNDGMKKTHVGWSIDAGESRSTWILPHVDSSGTIVRCRSGIDFWGERNKNFSGSFLLMDRRTLRYAESSATFTMKPDATFDVDTVFWNDSVGNTVDTVFIQYGVESSNADNGKPHMGAYALTSNPWLVFGVTITNPASSGSMTVHGWNTMKEALHHFGMQGFEIGDSICSVNELGGTAKRNITVSAYTARTVIPLWNGSGFLHDNCTPGDIFLSAGHGPTVDGRIKPDITAPGWSVIAALSRSAPRTWDETVVWPDTSTVYSRYGGATGTSMAAPIVAGIVALMLEADPTLTPERVKEILYSTAVQDQFTGALEQHSNTWGAGKVDAWGALADLLDISVIGKASIRQETKVSQIRISGRSIRMFAMPSVSAVTFELVDMAGRTVFRKERVESNIITLPHELAAGVYLATIQSVPSGMSFRDDNIHDIRQICPVISP